MPFIFRGGWRGKSYAIITLRSVEWALQSSFIDIVVLMLQKLQPVPSRKTLSVEVEKLITIFSALVNPPVKKIQGLWGELLVIEQSDYPEILINAWHSSPTAKYDFTMGRDKIEVKALRVRIAFIISPSTSWILRRVLACSSPPWRWENRERGTEASRFAISLILSVKSGCARKVSFVSDYGCHDR